MIAIGLMSGTSLDGIDAALVEVRPLGPGYALDLLGFTTHAFDAPLAQRLRATLPPSNATVRDAAGLHRALGGAFASAACDAAGGAPVDFVASHGQTIWHDGAQAITLQIGDPFAIRDAVRASVCFDFRSADCAAGGHGAPLVPYVDRLLFASDAEDRVALNIGGIANLTLLPRAGAASAYDAGPGNMLLDGLVRERTDGAQTFDRDGALAARGSVDQALLRAMLADEYFSFEPPKTTGRERFGAQFLARFQSRLAELSLEDGAATLTELTVAAIADAVRNAGFAAPRVLAAGGGAENPVLMERLQARLPHARVETTAAMGIPPQAKEAIAFAVLGYETLRERPANVPAATGASRPAVLGAIAPYRLSELLGRVEAECSTA